MDLNNNIAFVGPLPPPFGGVGVMNKSFQEIVSNEWNVLSFNTSNGKLSEDLYASKGLKNLLHVIKNLFGLFKFLAKNKFKIVNVFATSNIAFLRDSFIILILYFSRKQIIVHFHSKKKGEFFLGKYTLKYVAFIFRLTEKVIVLSKDHYDYFGKYFDVTKMVVIENFVDYDLYECGIENKIEQFLYVSRLSKKKGIFDLIAAVKILKGKGYNPIINVLGTPENDETKKIIESYLNKYQLADNVILHGNVFGKNKYQFFKSCSVFIFPSHFENSPVVIKEAIASSMGIICSDIEANKIILADKENTKFFISQNITDLANKIEEILLDPSIAARLMKNSSVCKIYDKRYAEEEIKRIFASVKALSY